MRESRGAKVELGMGGLKAQKKLLGEIGKGSSKTRARASPWACVWDTHAAEEEASAGGRVR